MRIIYISGRYRARTIFGIAWNIWKARRAARRLWKDWVVICPHMNTAFFTGGEGMYIRGDIEIVKRCDAIFLLKGWTTSEGSGLEYRQAIESKLKVIFEE